jgi:hypothetical protein
MLVGVGRRRGVITQRTSENPSSSKCGSKAKASSRLPQLALSSIEPEVESCIVERVIHPDDVENRRQIRSKAPHRVETKPSAGEGIGFDQDVGRRDERRLAGPECREGASGALVIGVGCAEQGE